MKNKSKYYRIPVCIFIFIIGTYAALIFSNALNDMLTEGRITTRMTDISGLIGNVLASDKLKQLFLLLEVLVLLMCAVYYVCADRSYQAETFAVTDEISVPMPYGQGQHGTAWFMSDKIKRRAFDYISISKADPLISRLVSIGKERYRAIENGEIFDPPKLDQTLTDSAGIVLAREMSRGTERLPCITDDYHTLTIGATRCGKSRCLVLQSICALALAGEGIVANDPKGELYHYTHSFLETLGYKVHVIDFNTPKKSDRYNPLQSIINAVNENRIDDAQNCVWDFVTFLVEKNDHSEPIWTNGECAVIAAAVMCVVYDNQSRPEYQNLTNVYSFIANMCKTVNKVMPIDAYMQKLPDSHPAKSLMAIAKIAPDKMGGSFFTSALTTLRLFITNDMYSLTRESEFSLDDIGKEPKQALFFILPDQKATYYPIVTLIVAQQYDQLVSYAKTRGNRLPHRVNFILDEFGNFAAIDKFQTKMTVAGGYGIRWNLFIQDFNQLIDVYGQEVAIASEYARGTKIIVIDPEGEYKDMCLNPLFEGDWIDVAGGRGGLINPLQIRPVPPDVDELPNGSEEPPHNESIGDLAIHLKTLETFFQLYIPSMDDRLRALLNKSLVELYMSFGIGWDTDVSGRTAEQFPTISDLYGIIRRKVQQKDSSSVYYEELLTYLESAANGADHLLWNGYTTIRSRSGFIVLDTKSLIQMSGTVLAAQYFNVLSWCWEQITHDRNERIMLVADECWTMIDPRCPQSLEFMSINNGQFPKMTLFR